MLRQHFPQAIETNVQGRIRINASALQLALDPANPAGAGNYNPDFGYVLTQGGKAQALYLVVETKGYDSEADIPAKEKWKIASARKFFAALQVLPALKASGVQIHYQTKINRDSLAQFMTSIAP